MWNFRILFPHLAHPAPAGDGPCAAYIASAVAPYFVLPAGYNTAVRYVLWHAHSVPLRYRSRQCVLFAQCVASSPPPATPPRCAEYSGKRTPPRRNIARWQCRACDDVTPPAFPPSLGGGLWAGGGRGGAAFRIPAPPFPACHTICPDVSHENRLGAAAGIVWWCLRSLGSNALPACNGAAARRRVARPDAARIIKTLSLI